MSLLVKAGETARRPPFALYDPADNYTRLTGQAGQLDIELWRAAPGAAPACVFRKAAGAAPTVNVVAVAVVELTNEGVPLGEYAASFPAGDAGVAYTLIIRHAASKGDLEESFEVWTATPSDLKAAIDAVAGGYLVTLAGEPFQVDDAMTLTVQFWTQRGPTLTNPDSVVTVELLGRDGLTVLQTKAGGDIANVGLGTRRVTFAAVDEVGFYFVRTTFVAVAGGAELTDVHPVQVANLAAVAVAGVMSVEELLRDFLGVLPGVLDPFDLLTEEDPETGERRRLLPDETIAAAIRREARYVERRLNLSLSTTRYACRPDIVIPGRAPLVKGEDYDEEVDPLDLQWPHSGGPAAIFTLPHRPVSRITRARILYGQTVLYGLPTRWFNLNRRQGHIRMIVDSGTFETAGAAIAYSATFGWILGAADMKGQKWPMVWAFDFEAGLPECPEDVKSLIGWRAVANLLPVAARRANAAAVQSQSTSKDGLSRSMSVSDSQPGGRFNALLAADLIKDWTSNDKLAEMRRLVRGGVRVY